MAKPPPSERPRTPAGTPSLTPPDERSAALRDVLDHAAKMQREVNAVAPKRRSAAPRVMAVVLCGLALAFSAYSIIARPDFIWGDSAGRPSPAIQSGLRLGVYVLAQRIEAFRATHERYPVALDEIEEDLGGGVQYAVLSDSVFVLRAIAGADTVTFRSDQPASTLIEGPASRDSSR